MYIKLAHLHCALRLSLEEGPNDEINAVRTFRRDSGIVAYVISAARVLRT